MAHCPLGNGCFLKNFVKKSVKISQIRLIRCLPPSVGVLFFLSCSVRVHNNEGQKFKGLICYFWLQRNGHSLSRSAGTAPYKKRTLIYNRCYALHFTAEIAEYRRGKN